MMDLPLLAPELSGDEVARGCRVARECNLACVVLRPSDVDVGARMLDGSGVAVGSTVGYPDGSSVTGTKLYEGRDLLRRGVREIDMTINVGKMIAREFQYVEMELLQMAKSCLESEALLKVHLRSELLADDLKIIAVKICKRVEAAMISIAGSDGDYAVIQPLLKERIALKVATPITSLDAALDARARGAARFACATPATILADWKTRLEAQRQPAT